MFKRTDEEHGVPGRSDEKVGRAARSKGWQRLGLNSEKGGQGRESFNDW